jgi:hypothetical protein
MLHISDVILNGDSTQVWESMLVELNWVPVVGKSYIPVIPKVPVSFKDRNSLKEVWDMAAYLLLPDAKVINVDVVDNDGHKVDERQLCGAIVNAVNPVIFRICIPMGKGFAMESIYDAMKAKVIAVRSIHPELYPHPSHDGWMKRDDQSLTVDIIMAENGYRGDDLRESFSRSSLWYHLQAGKSKLLGTFKSAIVKGGSIATHDGCSYGRRSSFPMMPGNIWKVCGYKDFEGFMNNQSLISKGMIKLLDDCAFDSMLNEYSLGSDVQVIIPEITPKFYNGETIVDLEYYSLFPARKRDRVAISLQGAGRMPLTSTGKKLIASTWKQSIQEIMSAYSDNTLESVIRMYSAHYRDYMDSMEDDAINGDVEAIEALSADLKEKAEEVGSSMVEMLYLPIANNERADEFINKTLPTLLRKRLKKIYVPGITATAMPANIGRRDVILPVSAKRMGVELGDRVTITRSPNTGLEWVEMTVIGFTNDDVIYLNPEMFAERHSGDFDGDIVGAILTGGLVDEEHVAGKVSSKSKGKKSQNVVLATAKAYYAKYAIPEADKCITLMIEAGQDPTPARELLQAIVDSIKHDVELTNLYTFKKANYISGDLLPVYKLLKGSVGCERGVLFQYNKLVREISNHRSRVEWIRNIENEFAFIMCGTKFLDVKAPKDNGYVPYGDYEMYKKMVTFFGRSEWAVPASYKAFTFDKANVAAIRGKVKSAQVKRAGNSEVVKLARRIHDSYFGAYNKAEGFCELRGQGRIDEAYDIIRAMSDELRSNPVIAGEALKYLWNAISYGELVDGSKVVQGYKLFSYMPTVIGTYDIAAIAAAYGNRPCADVLVVKRQDIWRYKK